MRSAVYKDPGASVGTIPLEERPPGFLHVQNHLWGSAEENARHFLRYKLLWFSKRKELGLNQEFQSEESEG